MGRETLTACYTARFGGLRGEWGIAGSSRTHKLMNQGRHSAQRVSFRLKTSPHVAVGQNQVLSAGLVVTL